jgi:hypothetical protein
MATDLRENILLIFPMYAEELLYNLTKVTESNEREILRLAGVEFWGQTKKNPVLGANETINRRYIYGIINTGFEGVGYNVPSGSKVYLHDLTNVTPFVPKDLMAICSGITLFNIPANGKYGCLFEKPDQPELMGLPALDINQGEKKYFTADYTGPNVVLEWETATSVEIPPLESEGTDAYNLQAKRDEATGPVTYSWVKSSANK